MKLITKIIILSIIVTINTYGQVTEIANINFKAINIGNHGKGDYTKSVILLHQVYNGTKMKKNYAIGTISAMRGNTNSYNRTNVVNVNTSSAYTNIAGAMNSLNSDSLWKLVTVNYNNNKYIALLVPYKSAWHHLGFQFRGWTYSTAENMKIIAYEKSGSVLNSEIANSIQPFNPNMIERHDVSKLIINGVTGIGTSDTKGYQLAIAGKAIAEEMVIKLKNTWPDFVFENNYKLPTLIEVENHIKTKGHLQDIPSAKEVEKNGILLGKMDAKLLQKIEELTLYTIQQEKEIKELRKHNQQQSNDIQELKALCKQLLKK